MVKFKVIFPLLIINTNWTVECDFQFSQSRSVSDDIQLDCHLPGRSNTTFTGVCTDLFICQSLFNQVRNFHTLDMDKREYLRKAVCGYSGKYPKVCCAVNNGSEDVHEETSTKPKPNGDSNESDETYNGKEMLKICGQSWSIHQKIVGGKTSQDHAWPWIAALGYKNSKTGKVNFLCGGSLISKQHVLTAAHCVVRNDLVLVRMGDNSLNTNVTVENRASFDSPDMNERTPRTFNSAHEYAVRKRIIHKGYSRRNQNNDIAILELDEPVLISRKIRPICLPSQVEDNSEKENEISGRSSNFDFQDMHPFITGWGATRFRGPRSMSLMEIQLKVISNKKCERAMKNLRNVNIDKRKICAIDEDGMKDACQGDSGGPMMMPQKIIFPKKKESDASKKVARRQKFRKQNLSARMFENERDTSETSTTIDTTDVLSSQSLNVSDVSRTKKSVDQVFDNDTNNEIDEFEEGTQEQLDSEEKLRDDLNVEPQKNELDRTTNTEHQQTSAENQETHTLEISKQMVTTNGTKRRLSDIANITPHNALVEHRWILIGVVSYGYKCAVPGFPGVYTRVSDYSHWIDSNLAVINGNSKSGMKNGKGKYYQAKVLNSM